MKLGEALAERARLQTRIGELRSRINDNAATQEGQGPAEDPEELLEEATRIHKDLAELIAKINLTNTQTPLEPHGMRLMDWTVSWLAIAALVTYGCGLIGKSIQAFQPPPMHQEDDERDT